MRRRRNQGTWFPTIGTADPNAGVDNVNGREFEITLDNNGTSQVLIAPIIPDQPTVGDDIDVTAGGQLVAALGQEYLLKRIVGKLFITYPAIGEIDGPQAVLVGAGFFVARATQQDGTGGADQPLGAASLAERREYFSPLSEDTIREPWIWRRVWILSKPQILTINNNDGATATVFPQVAGGFGQLGFPSTNVGYGSVADGPHIDAKSRRRVSSDERLWFAIALRSWPIAAAGVTDPLIRGYLDVRVFGLLRKARNRGVF